MANSRSARKRIRVNETKRVRNRAVRSAVRTKVTQAKRILLGGATEATGDLERAVGDAVKALDRAAEKGILHRNNAIRRKSRLMATAARITRAAGEGGDTHQAVRASAAGGQKGRTSKAAARGKASAKPAAKGKVSKTGRTTAATRKPSGAPTKSPK